MPNLYIIAGCNGAGKTTASFTILPEMLDCDEFINADEIARGLSPLNYEKSAIEAGRIMLKRIDQLIKNNNDFAFETTLASKSYIKTIEKVKRLNYNVNLIFFWLESPALAIERVRLRVQEGGHNIPSKIIKRRYFSGLKNLFEYYIPKCDYWMIFNNSESPAEFIAEGFSDAEINIKNNRIFDLIKKMKDEK
jgi:predicted ABC-type ATPase